MVLNSYDNEKEKLFGDLLEIKDFFLTFSMKLIYEPTIYNHFHQSFKKVSV